MIHQFRREMAFFCRSGRSTADSVQFLIVHHEATAQCRNSFFDEFLRVLSLFLKSGKDTPPPP